MNLNQKQKSASKLDDGNTSPSRFIGQKQTKGDKISLRPQMDYLNIGEKDSIDDIKPKDSEMFTIAPLAQNPFKGIENVNSDHLQQNQKKQKQKKVKDSLNEGSLKGLLIQEQSERLEQEEDQDQTGRALLDSMGGNTYDAPQAMVDHYQEQNTVDVYEKQLQDIYNPVDNQDQKNFSDNLGQQQQEELVMQRTPQLINASQKLEGIILDEAIHKKMSHKIVAGTSSFAIDSSKLSKHSKNNALSGTEKPFSTNPFNDDTKSGMGKNDPFEDRIVKGEQANTEKHQSNETDVDKDFNFKEDVDFYHQIAYRFEKSQKLREKIIDKYLTKGQHRDNNVYKQKLKEIKFNAQEKLIIDLENNKIKELINNGLWIIKLQPMIMFYCMYYCVFYYNKEMVNFVLITVLECDLATEPQQQLITNYLQGVKNEKRKDKDRNGEKEKELDDQFEDTEHGRQMKAINEQIQRLTCNEFEELDDITKTISMEFYHEVFYKAVDDGQLRFVYDQILKRLNDIYLRDKDAIHFINTRDFVIINEAFKKNTKSHMVHLKMHKNQTKHKSCKYKKYNRAYFQELIISNPIEQRTKFLFEQKFLKTTKDIDSVLEMYCQIDNLEQFYKYTHGRSFSEAQITNLFLVALRYNSFKIAFQIHEEFGIRWASNQKKKHEKDEDSEDARIKQLRQSIRDSQYYFEIKMFFVKQAFSVFTVDQMDKLLILFTEILFVNNPRYHPLINCYNPVKASILIYEICWQIQRKNIYSLERKCMHIMSYINKSLDSYFEKQGNITHLYRLMIEPVLHPKDQKDSMDMMLEMQMDDIIKHKVVEEVVNLVYDGKYSIDSSSLYLSSLWFIHDQVETLSPKSVFRRIFTHINTWGSWRRRKQSSIQFHIWKQCIKQRETDEFYFISFISTAVIYLSVLINNSLSDQFGQQLESFGKNVYADPQFLKTVDPKDLEKYCEIDLQLSELAYGQISQLVQIQVLCAVSYLAQVLCMLNTVYQKNNIKLGLGRILSQLSMVVTGVVFQSLFNEQRESILSVECKRVIELDAQQAFHMDQVFNYQVPRDSIISFYLVLSIIVCQHCLNFVDILQRIDGIGSRIIMMLELRHDLILFFQAFSIPMIGIVIIGMMNSSTLTTDNLNFFDIFLNLFAAFTGEQDFGAFTVYSGQLYLVIFIILYFILLLNLLIAKFSNSYSKLSENEAAHKLRRILEIKNHLGYDPIIGAVTSTFFPMNIVMLVLQIPVVAVKNKKLNEMVNKLQYAIMIFFQSFLIMIFQIIMAPIMYVKIVINSFHIMIISKNDTRIERYMEPLFGIIASPFLITISIAVDIITLPTVLLKEDEEFEEKYQKSIDSLNQDQLLRVNKVFEKILNKDWNKYKGGYTTYIELMNMHRSRFKIMENLNDLLCKGSKDYKESLSTVKDFNSTKTMTRICSVPSKDNDITQNKIYFDMLKIIKLDIEIFNHIFDRFNGGLGMHGDFEINKNGDHRRMAYSEAVETIKSGEQGDKTLKQQMDDEDANVTDQFMRDPLDVMSFYQTNILCESFTDTQKFQQSEHEKNIGSKIDELYNQISETMFEQQCDIIDTIHKQFNNDVIDSRIDLLKDKMAVPTSNIMQEIYQTKGDEKQNVYDDKKDEVELDYKKEGEAGSEDEKQQPNNGPKPKTEVKNKMFDMKKD